MISDEPVTGRLKKRHRLENKRKRIEKQGRQEPVDYWRNHRGLFKVPKPTSGPTKHRNKMCPTGLALHHPAADLLLQYTTKGCPTETRKNWSKEEMTAAVERGPHSLALEEAPMVQQ